MSGEKLGIIEQKLLPCPFCGGECEFYNNNPVFERITCNNCNVALWVGDGKIMSNDEEREHLTKIWNTRTRNVKALVVTNKDGIAW